MILREPKRLDSFSRCETDYSLIEFDDGSVAIEWNSYNSGDPSYAIVYHDIHKAIDDFNGLRSRRLGYDEIVSRTAKEDVLDSCPWSEEGLEEVTIAKLGIDDHWNIFTYPHDWIETRIGPYDSLQEAVDHLEEDYKTFRADIKAQEKK